MLVSTVIGTPVAALGCLFSFLSLALAQVSFSSRQLAARARTPPAVVAVAAVVPPIAAVWELVCACGSSFV